MEFSYDLNVMRPRIPSAEILASLREFGKKRRGRAFTKAEWDAWPKRRCDGSVVNRRFGSWRGALELVGIKGGRRWGYRADELVRLLEDVWREVGHPPGVRLLRIRGGVSPAPFVRHWGSLRRVYERVAAFHAGKITREDLMRGVGRPEPRRQGPGRTLRWLILERDGHRCVSCGRSPATDGLVVLELDHIVPVCRGGTNEESNLRTLCRECNRGKRGRMDQANPGEEGKRKGRPRLRSDNGARA